MMQFLAVVTAVLFWLLCATGVIALASFIYVESQYYHWNKTDHDGTLVQEVYDKVTERIEEVNEDEK